MRNLSTAAVIGALSLGLALPASAMEDGVSIAVVVIEKDSPSAGQAIVIGQVARQGFARNPKYAVLDLEQVLSDGALGMREEKRKEAEERLESGMAAYDAFELDQALESLAEALVAYENALGTLDDIAPIADALRFQGAAYALQGDADAAKAAFARAFALDPDGELEGGRFPDTVQALYEQARESADNAPTGSVTVFAAPAAAEVYIDGNFKGSAPITVEDLAVGRHYIRVVRDGYVAYGEAVDIVAGQEETVQGTLRTTAKLGEFDGLRRRLAQGDERAAADLAALLQVDQLFSATVEATGDSVKISGTLTDGVQGTALSTQDKSFATSSARFKPELEAWLAENFRKEGGGQSAVENTAQGGEDFMNGGPVDRPTSGFLIAGWVVTALTIVPIIVAIAAGVTSLYGWDFYRNRGELFQDITGATGVQNQIDAQTDAGQTALLIYGIASVVTDVSWVVAAATLATGIALIVVGLNQEAEIDDVLAAGPRDDRGRYAGLGTPLEGFGGDYE